MTAVRRWTALTATVAIAALTLVAMPSSASAHHVGTRPLAAVLTADGDKFDRNWHDFDIVTEGALAVLGAKPDSPVGVLTDGSVRLTAFLPNDRAFQLLVWDLTGRWYHRESKVFEAVAGLGIDTVETVLLYHVVPGVTIDSRTALRSDGAVLTTAQGGTFKVDVLSRWFRIVRLIDQDPNDMDPFLVPNRLDLNKGNKQIAHGIYFVLRPADL